MRAGAATCAEAASASGASSARRSRSRWVIAELVFGRSGVAQSALELAREVAREPRGEVGAIERVELGERRSRGGDVALEDLGEQMLVDAFAKRGRHERENR